MPKAIRYCFSQSFKVPAKTAYDWCTDYQPDDPARAGFMDAKRSVTWVTDSTVLVKDAFQVKGVVVEKEKLVQLYADKQMWISTHLTGPNKYSQFTYQIVAEGKDSSRLDFGALNIEYREDLTDNDLKRRAEDLCRGDAAIWKRLAAAMEKELPTL